MTATTNAALTGWAADQGLDAWDLADLSMSDQTDERPAQAFTMVRSDRPSRVDDGDPGDQIHGRVIGGEIVVDGFS